MKNISVILSSLALVGVIALWAVQMNKGTTGNATTSNPTGGIKIAYVNIDTLEAHYDLLKTRKEEFKAKQEQMENELQRSYQQMQSKGEDIQRKAQAQTLTQSEYQAAEKQLMLMQQSLETRKNSLTESLMKEQEELNKDIKNKLNAYLDEYNKNRHFDYIVSYSAAGGSPIMYANKSLEITQDVIKGLNAMQKK